MGNSFLWTEHGNPLQTWYQDVALLTPTSGGAPSTASSHDNGDGERGSSNSNKETYIGFYKQGSREYIASDMIGDLSEGNVWGCSAENMCSTCLTDVDDLWSSAWLALKCGCQSVPSSSGGVNLGTLLTFVVTTWNAAGLFCDSSLKYTKKIRFANSLLAACTVCCFQETHDNGDTAMAHFVSMNKNEFDFYSDPLTSAAGGTLIAIRHSYVALFDCISPFVIWKGRISGVALFSDNVTFAFVTVHIHGDDGSANGKIAMLQVLREFVEQHKRWHFFICGDFNFITDYVDRSELQSGSSIGRICSAGRYWDQHFSIFDEFYQGSHTRFPAASSTNSGSSARLDRIYGNTPVEAFALYDIRTNIEGNLPDRELSDHLPVSSCIRLKSRQHGLCCVPQHVVREEGFQKKVNLMMNKFQFEKCCWAKLIQCKSIFKASYHEYMATLKIRGAEKPKDRILWCLQAIRASTVCDMKFFTDAMEALPSLLHSSYASNLPITLEHLEHIRGILRVALSLDDDEVAREVRNATDIPEHDRKALASNLAKKLAMHNPWKRKLGITAVQGDDGRPIHDEDLATAHLAKYWGEQFEEKPIDERLAKAFTNTFANKFPQFVLTLCFAAFLDMIRTSKRSAPGPDGIPYLAWGCSLRAQVFLFECCAMWLICGACPVFFNVAYLWLLPKGNAEEGVFEPRDTRPLSGANSDAKIFAKFLAISFNRLLNDWAFQGQRGFIHGRSMLKMSSKWKPEQQNWL